MQSTSSMNLEEAELRMLAAVDDVFEEILPRSLSGMFEALWGGPPPPYMFRIMPWENPFKRRLVRRRTAAKARNIKKSFYMRYSA